MSFDLLKIFHEMDTMARGVTLALLIMGVASLSVFFERLVTYWRSRRQSKLFARIAGEFVARREYHRLAERVKDFPASHLARMFSRPLALCVALKESQDREARAATVELVRREVQRQHEEAGSDLRRGLGVLASVGSIAPFVGLLGTVVGIIAAFTKISVTGSGGLSSVAGGISEALVVTALGLLVAIPSVLFYNSLATRADRIHQGLSVSAGQFIDHIELRGSANVPAIALEGKSEAAERRARVESKHDDLRIDAPVS
jgi:biopolymer transport protein ExbB